jgi:hypothetical protein
LLSSLKALDDKEKKQFATVIISSADPREMAKKPTPEIIRVADVTKKFMNAYKAELMPLIENGLSE